jgi:hypothetical protein
MAGDRGIYPVSHWHEFHTDDGKPISTTPRIARRTCPGEDSRDRRAGKMAKRSQRCEWGCRIVEWPVSRQCRDSDTEVSRPYFL